MDRPRTPGRPTGMKDRNSLPRLAPPGEGMDRPRVTEPDEPVQGRRLRALPHDRRIVLLAMATGLPGMLVSLGFLWFTPVSPGVRGSVTILLVLAAIREGDSSIRARVPDEGSEDALSLAYREVNALESILREQRLGAVEASEILRKVLESVDVALFAFHEDGELGLVNRAGEKLVGQPADKILGRTAAELRLDEALEGPAPRTLELSYPGGQGRWELRRSIVRQEGMPLQLLVLSDLSRALREEERQAWKRIIRVLSHEINNSLAPIKSISASLQSLMERDPAPDDLEEDVARGLGVIQTRAEALGRFMGAYARLARLPEPTLSRVRVGELVRRVAALEVRLPVQVRDGPQLEVRADPDQLEQLLINLIRNAVDASLEGEGGPEPEVAVGWEADEDVWRLRVLDRGQGIPETGNLFVPFYTTKPGGSGIGLALSRQIAEGHGGTLELRNRTDGPGAEAVIELPLG